MEFLIGNPFSTPVGQRIGKSLFLVILAVKWVVLWWTSLVHTTLFTVLWPRVNGRNAVQSRLSFVIRGLKCLIIYNEFDKNIKKKLQWQRRGRGWDSASAVSHVIGRCDLGDNQSVQLQSRLMFFLTSSMMCYVSAQPHTYCLNVTGPLQQGFVKCAVKLEKELIVAAADLH